MKRVLVAVVLLFAIAGGCVVSLVHQHAVLQRCMDATTKMETLFVQGDTASALAVAETFCEEYRRETRWFPLFFPHDTLTEMEKSVTSLPAILQHGEPKDFVAETRRCRLLLQNLHDLEMPTWQNIL